MLGKKYTQKKYKTKKAAEDARVKGERTVPRKNLQGHRIWLNQRYAK
jgi:hypothetical protein